MRISDWSSDVCSSDLLGAQGTVLAGGRYDGLIEALGGPETPGVGWAAGFERLAMLIDAPQEEKPHAVLIPMGAAAEKEATGLLAGLRLAGITSDMAFPGTMKKRMQRSNRSGAQFAGIHCD